MMYDSDNEDEGLDEETLSGFDINETNTSSQSSEEYKYEILNSNQIVESMVSSLKEVNNVVKLSVTITRILLNHFKWDKERLYERLFDGSRETLFAETKIIDTTSNAFKQKHQHQSNNFHQALNSNTCNNAQSSRSFQTQLCPICCCDNADLGLDCGHAFCRHCWIMYLSTKIMEDGQSGRIMCPAHDCNILVDDQAVLPMVTDPKVRLRYQQLITNSYVECNRQMRWCPKPECGHAIKVVYPEMQPVKCECGTVFCFTCGDNWHEPVKCDLMKKWKKKCDDDSETSHWIAANTKECPKCHVTIEKNGGCNHMICKQNDCKTEFCWICLGAWNVHGSAWYSCNRYDESDARSARDAQERSRALLQRYLHYCKRYMNHMQSLKFEHRLYASIKEKMRAMQQHNMSWIEVQFLNKAVDILCQCRQTLMYTYVFAYYQSKTNHSEIFELNQNDLENATEDLSGYLEREVTSESLLTIKQTVQDKYRYCESRRRILLEHVQEGYDQDLWVYTEL